MKTLMLISLLALSSAAFAWPIDINGKPLFPANMPASCEATGDVALFVYRHRDDISQEKALDILEDNWNGTWAKDPDLEHANYVDLQRLVRDAYRTDSSGEFKRECCTEEAVQNRTYGEVISCLRSEGVW